VSALRTLDERVVPRLARGLRRVAGADPAAAAGPAPGRDRRGRWLTTLAVLVVLGVAVTSVLAAGREPAVDETTGDVVRVGPVEGDRVDAYTAAAAAELAGLDPGTEAYALVQLAAYATPAGLDRYAGGVQVAMAYARVPIPQTQTEIVPLPVATLAEDVPAAMTRTARRKEREARDFTRTAAGLSGDDERERGLRAFYLQSAELSRTEAAAYSRHCACVYALVVVGTPDRLRAIAGLPGVRVVDPAPEVRRLDRTVFLPLLPEQTTVVAPLPDAALPGPAPLPEATLPGSAPASAPPSGTPSPR